MYWMLNNFYIDNSYLKEYFEKVDQWIMGQFTIQRLICKYGVWCSFLVINENLNIIQNMDLYQSSSYIQLCCWNLSVYFLLRVHKLNSWKLIPMLPYLIFICLHTMIGWPGKLLVKDFHKDLLLLIYVNAWIT